LGRNGNGVLRNRIWKAKRWWRSEKAKVGGDLKVGSDLKQCYCIVWERKKQRKGGRFRFCGWK